MNCNPQLTVFNFEEVAQVRVVMQNGQPWFIAKDVCNVLELTNPTETLRNLDEDEKTTLRNSEGHAGSGAQRFNIINESGLYTLVMRSNKTRARKFRKWVTSEVLPSIRQTGGYAVPSQPELPMDTPPAVTEFSPLRYKGVPVIPTWEMRKRLGVTRGQFEHWIHEYKPMIDGVDCFRVVGLPDKLILSVIKAGFKLNPNTINLCLYAQSGFNKALAHFGSTPPAVSVPVPI